MLNNTDSSFSNLASLTFGHWTLLPHRKTIDDGTTIRELEPLMFNLLRYLIIHRERIVSRQELIDNVWQQNYVDDNAINRAISELRKVLTSDKQKARIVKTHYRTGYSFILPVELTYLTEQSDNTENNTVITQTAPLAAIETPVVSASSHKPILQSQSVTEPIANGQTSTAQTKITQNKHPYGYALALLFLVAVCIAYFNYDDLVPKTEAEASSTLRSTSSPKPLPLSFSEEILSWDNGFIEVIKLSKDEQLLAYSLENLTEADYALHIKDLQSLKLYKVLSASQDPIYPLAWSEGHTLVYQILNPANTKCEVWQVDFSQPKLNNVHKKLFDCEGTKIISADIATADNQLIYSKYGYRGKSHLSALASRDLSSGAEFQISSPNTELRGDYFVTLSTNQQQVVFLRSQQAKTEIFIANKNGSEQIKLHSVDYVISLLQFNNSNTELLWVDSLKNNLVTFNLKTKQISYEYLDTSHDLSQRFKTEIISNKHIISVTDNSSIDIDKLEINNASPKLSGYLNSPHYEGFVAPFNLSDASIFVSATIEATGFWLFKDGIKKRLFNTDIKHISGLSLSPDDSMLLVATNKNLYIYDTLNYELIKEIRLPGDILHASWPVADKLLLTYTSDSNKSYAWFYQWQQEKFFKLTNRYTKSAILISEDTLLFLDDKLQLIQKNIDSSESKPLVTLSDKAGVRWTADKNNIFYVKNTNDKYIRKIPLNDVNKEVQYAVPSKRTILELTLNNNLDNPVLYSFYFEEKNNHIIELKVKQ